MQLVDSARLVALVMPSSLHYITMVRMPQAQRVTGRARPNGLGLDAAVGYEHMLSRRSGNVSVPRTWHAPRDHAVRA